MSPTAPDDRSGPELIWCVIDVPALERVLTDYSEWKHDPWYSEVNWLLVCARLDAALQAACREGVAHNLMLVAEAAGQSLHRAQDRQGLESLVMFPITATNEQIINGGHRLKAMTAQGVRATSGVFVREDIGETIDPLDVYPTLRPPNHS